MGKASEFSLAQKKEILLYRQSHVESGQRISNKALTLWANAKFQASSSEMSISRYYNNILLVLHLYVLCFDLLNSIFL